MTDPMDKTDTLQDEDRVILLEATVKNQPYTMQATKIAMALQAILPYGSDVRVAVPEEFATPTPHQANLIPAKSTELATPQLAESLDEDSLVLDAEGFTYEQMQKILTWHNAVLSKATEQHQISLCNECNVRLTQDNVIYRGSETNAMYHEVRRRDRPGITFDATLDKEKSDAA